jgi:hypothetical protein
MTTTVSKSHSLMLACCANFLEAKCRKQVSTHAGALLVVVPVISEVVFQVSSFGGRELTAAAVVGSWMCRFIPTTIVDVNARKAQASKQSVVLLTSTLLTNLMQASHLSCLAQLPVVTTPP